MSESKGVKAWFKERFPLATFGYEVPSHANTFLFSLGGITMISVAILIVTGIILAQFYSANPTTANQSLRTLMTQYQLGPFIRSLHVWAAEIAVVTLLLHILRLLFYGSYKKPREINWLIGVVLFALMIGLFFTGTVIKWDQEGYEALAHTTAIGKLLGPLGIYLSPTFISNVALMSKFFTLHISILPVLLVTVIVAHLYLVKMLKISPLPYAAKSEDSGKHTFFQHIYKLIGYAFIFIGLLFILAVLFPSELGPKPVIGVEAYRPPWLFMGIFSIENWAGIPGLIWGAVVVAIMLILAPFVDRGKTQLFKDRKAFVILSALTVLLLVGLTVNAYATKPKQHIGMGGGEAASTSMDSGSMDASSGTVKSIDDAMNVVTQLQTAITNKDATSGKTLAGKLDETLDPVKGAIKSKDAALVDQLKTDDLTDVFKDSAPDFVKAGSLVDGIQKALNQAKDMFSGPAAKIDDAMGILGQMKSALASKDMKMAGDKATALDGTLDPIKKDLQSKDASLVSALDTDSLMDLMKDANPDVAKINAMLGTMQTALDKAKAMYASGTGDNNMKPADAAKELADAKTIVVQVRDAVSVNNLPGAYTLSSKLDKALDPLKDALKDKDPSLVDALNTDGLLDALQDPAPDLAKINSILDEMNNALDQAGSLFK